VRKADLSPFQPSSELLIEIGTQIGSVFVPMISLVLACVFPKQCWLAILLALAGLAIATVAESTFASAIRLVGPSRALTYLMMANSVQVAWILLIGLTVRYAGYRLIREGRKS
jgi:hypothetical protein